MTLAFNRDVSPRPLPLATLLICAALASPLSAAPRRLVAVGGGDRPAAAMQRFVEWSGGPRARLLVVMWASGEPEESFALLKGELQAHGPAAIEQAPPAPLGGEARARLLEQLAAATGIFFSGGDQNRVMDVLRDEELLRALRARYAAGVPFGGTSAGAAVMSTPMITGEGDFTVIDAAQVGTREGLGLLPGVVLDQHFVRRQRQNRLFGLILARPELLGLGIDEDTALLVSDDRQAEVVGRGPVLVVDGLARSGALVVEFLGPGQRYDVVKRRRLAGAARSDLGGSQLEAAGPRTPAAPWTGENR